MRILVLWADEVSANLGVRALARGTELLARRVWPDAEISFHNFGSSDTPVRVGSVRSALKERITRRGGLEQWLSGFDLVLDTRSGDSFSDLYGVRRLVVMSMMADAVSRAGTPVVLTPQTIGPFATPAGRQLGRRAMRRALLVMARDSVSAGAARSLGRSVDVLASDVVFGLPVPVVARTRDVLLNVSGLLWTSADPGMGAGYRQMVRNLVRTLQSEGRQVGLLAHVLDSPSSDNDLTAIRDLQREAGSAMEVIVPTNLDDVREATASAALTIGSRMHACLNSLSVGTPAIALAYSRKFGPLFDDIGWGLTVDLRTAQDPLPIVRQVLGDVESLRRSAREAADRGRQLLDGAESALGALA